MQTFLMVKSGGYDESEQNIFSFSDGADAHVRSIHYEEDEPKRATDSASATHEYPRHQEFGACQSGHYNLGIEHRWMLPRPIDVRSVSSGTHRSIAPRRPP
ncbi:MAG TPA: hypothetical protein VN777_15390 [Terriglobales bacterium]|nr:hypothetical protein [Terriglobales bacterium]HZW93060.1 hypothetical protein [Candidatus Eremiobacteraceae bacterium]